MIHLPGSLVLIKRRRSRNIGLAVWSICVFDPLLIVEQLGAASLRANFCQGDEQLVCLFPSEPQLFPERLRRSTSPTPLSLRTAILSG